MTTAPKILISAYACSPKYGSEPGMGWNWVNQISEHFDTWVLTDEYYAKDCREYLATSDIEKPKLHIVGIQRPGGRHRIYGYFWLHYLTQNLWQRTAFRAAKDLHKRERFDLIHQLNMIGYREPGYLWQLDDSIPFFWGPIGGYAQMPRMFLPFLNIKDRLVYGLRNVLNAWQMKHLKRVRSAMQRADVLFGATRVDVEAICRVHGRRAILLNETGTSLERGNGRLPLQKFADATRSLELVWSGVFLGRKALPLGLYALARARKQEPNLRVRLTIVGDGPCGPTWKHLSEDLGVADWCVWTGWLSHDQALEQTLAADAMLFTSLQEAASTVVPEALMYGIPVICHDACGFGGMVTDSCGIKIPIADPETSIKGFTDAILLLAKDRGLLSVLSNGALVRAKELTWKNQMKILLAQYEQVLTRHNLADG